MPIEPIKEFEIDNVDDAESYLRDLLRKPENRSMALIREHAQIVKGEDLRKYFTTKAEEMLRTLN